MKVEKEACKMHNVKMYSPYIMCIVFYKVQKEKFNKISADEDVQRIFSIAGSLDFTEEETEVGEMGHYSYLQMLLTGYLDGGRARDFVVTSLLFDLGTVRT